MKKFSPVVVAFVSFCLISFHSNPAFAAVIDAGAPPEDAVTVPLEESDDATAASVIDAIPEEAASVPSRRRKLSAKKTGGGQDLIGNGTDTHDCDIKKGYSWCASLNECIHWWITACPTTSPVTTPPPVPSPTPPGPVPDSLVEVVDDCTGLHGDPYSSDVLVPCCEGLYEDNQPWNGPDEKWNFQCEKAYTCKPIFDQRADGHGPADPITVSRDPSVVKSGKGGEWPGECVLGDEPGCNGCKDSIWDSSNTPGETTISTWGVDDPKFCRYSASMLCQDVLDPSNVAPVKMKDIVSVDLDVQVLGCQATDVVAFYFFDAHKAKGDDGYTTHWDITREPDVFETMGTCIPSISAGTIMHNWAGLGDSGYLKALNSATEDLFVNTGSIDNPLQKHLSFTQKRGGGSTTWDSYGCDVDKVTTSGQCPKSGDGTPGWSHGHYSNVPDNAGCDVECSSSSNKECCHAFFMVDNWNVMTNGCSFTVYNLSVKTSAPNSY